MAVLGLCILGKSSVSECLAGTVSASGSGNICLSSLIKMLAEQQLFYHQIM